MDQSLKVLINQKRQLESEVATLQARLQRLNAAIEALTAGDFFDEMKSLYAQKRRPLGTLKQMAFTVLYESGEAMTALQILQSIYEKFGVKIERTSMSPQLSRLGQDRVLLRRDNLWTLNPQRPAEVDRFYLLKSEGDLI